MSNIDFADGLNLFNRRERPNYIYKTFSFYIECSPMWRGHLISYSHKIRLIFNKRAAYCYSNYSLINLTMAIPKELTVLYVIHMIKKGKFVSYYRTNEIGPDYHCKECVLSSLIVEDEHEKPPKPNHIEFLINKID